MNSSEELVGLAEVAVEATVAEGGRAGASGEGRSGWRCPPGRSRPIADAVVAKGFSFRRKAVQARHPEIIQPRAGAIRGPAKAGAAAVDLAWVGSGVFDGFFELGLEARMWRRERC